MSQPTHIRAELAAEGADPHADQAVRLPGARAGQGGDAGPGAAGPRSRADHGVHPHQADRREGRRRAHRAGLRRRRRARRPRPGRPRAGPAGVPVRQGRRAGGHRRGGPRHRRRGRHARHQLPVPGRGQDLHPPDRPDRAGRQDRHRGVLHRLGRRAALEADQRVPRAGLRRPGGDLLHLQAPVRGSEHPGRDQRSAAVRAAGPGGAGRRGGRGPGRDRRQAAQGGAIQRRPLARRRTGDQRCARWVEQWQLERAYGTDSNPGGRSDAAERTPSRPTQHPVEAAESDATRQTRPLVGTGPVAAPAAAGPPTRPSRCPTRPRTDRHRLFPLRRLAR